MWIWYDFIWFLEHFDFFLVIGFLILWFYMILYGFRFFGKHEKWSFGGGQKRVSWISCWTQIDLLDMSIHLSEFVKYHHLEPWRVLKGGLCCGCWHRFRFSGFIRFICREFQKRKKWWRVALFRHSRPPIFGISVEHSESRPGTDVAVRRGWGL